MAYHPRPSSIAFSEREGLSDPMPAAYFGKFQNAGYWQRLGELSRQRPPRDALLKKLGAA